jgi:two-component system, chemotaxis family, sensor kinase CheA
MNPLLDQFVLEARDLVQGGSDDLVALERAPDDPERLERTFRAFHTLKGGAAIADLPVMAGLLHAGEDVLASLRAREIPINPTIIDTALRCLDEIGHWLDAIEASGALPAQAFDRADILSKELRQHLPQSSAPASREAGPAFDWARALIAATPGATDEARRNGGAVAIAYEPNANCFFNGDDPIGLLRKVPRLLALKIEPRSPWPPLQDMNPFDCNLAFRALALAPRPQIAEIFRFVPDQARIADVALDGAGTGDPSQTAPIRAILQAQRDLLAHPCAEQEFIGRLGAAARTATNVLRFAGADADADGIAHAHEEAAARRAAGPVVDALDRLLAAQTTAPPGNAGAAAVPSTAGVAGPSRGSRALRIEEAKVDTLVNVAGELIVAMNGLNELSARIVRELGEGETARALRSQNADIARLVTQAHRAVVQLRLVHLAQAFRGFPRIVRDTAQELGKSVAFTVKGEDIEADKSIVDTMFEPLLHLVRNALGHGIEPPDDRRRAGKPAEAQLVLSALRVGEQLIIEVVDDGRGIDPETVRRKVRELSLMPDDQLADLRDEQIIQLVFWSGFSTATEVSQMSGRGVGLAAVRSAAESVGGSVNVTSGVGRGTTVRLTLPSSLALVRIMTVRSGGEVFGVPIEAVVETVRLPRDRLIGIKNGQAFVLRDQIVPTCRLDRLLDLPESGSRGGDALILVTHIGGEAAGIEVDGIGERLDVVMKPMQGLLAEASDYAGTTLLGNGRVLLVLNLGAILP